MSRKIKTTNGKTVLVDAADFKWLSKYNWCSSLNHKKNGNYYVRRSDSNSGITILMHREIMKVSSPLLVVDHINHDTLDNQKKNLRVCTKSQNLRNRRGCTRTSFSGLRGVHRNNKKYKKQWRARIRAPFGEIHLGSFANKHEASLAYWKANRKYFEKFGGNVA